MVKGKGEDFEQWKHFIYFDLFGAARPPSSAVNTEKDNLIVVPVLSCVFTQ